MLYAKVGLLAFKPLLHTPFLWKERKNNSIIVMIVLLLYTLIFGILRQVLDLSFRALSVTNTGDTSVYYSCCHLYQRLNRT